MSSAIGAFDPSVRDDADTSPTKLGRRMRNDFSADLLIFLL